MNKKTIALMTGTAMVGVFGTFFATLPSEQVQSAGMSMGTSVGMVGMGAKNMERCYGIAKAGKNDCADKAATHHCAGQAKKDADINEFILVPRGMCEKIIGGTIE